MDTSLIFAVGAAIANLVSVFYSFRSREQIRNEYTQKTGQIRETYKLNTERMVEDYEFHINRLAEEIELLKTNEVLYGCRNNKLDYQIMLTLLRKSDQTNT